VTSPSGDKFSIYDAATRKASTLRLPASEGSKLKVVPILGDELISLMLDGPRITRLYVFSLKDWRWHPQDLKEPVAGVVSPLIGRSIAGYQQGRHVHAFSARKKRWSVLELPEDAPARANCLVSLDSVVVEYDGHVHEFSGETGEWKHTDLRAVIDAAIESTKEESD
jgi:hypothetical protein